ncbi:MAG: helix-hairpin-helix domain-containing protein [Verrucomicrobiota bacterium]|nr:helix-hairpin-helix domain-containing protein [Verrucomicrobiota bacterium]
MKKAADAQAATTLEAIPNVGRSVAQDLRSLGIERPRQLIGRDPHALYLALCERTGVRQDPCVLDTFISAVRFMEGAPPLPWWHYTAERKKSVADGRMVLPHG